MLLLLTLPSPDLFLVPGRCAIYPRTYLPLPDALRVTYGSVGHTRFLPTLHSFSHRFYGSRLLPHRAVAYGSRLLPKHFVCRPFCLVLTGYAVPVLVYACYPAHLPFAISTYRLH